MTSAPSLVDSFGRTMRDLRISITDRCNFRCLYCLPETEEAANFYRDRFVPAKAKEINYSWKPKSQFLTYEEIERVVQVGAECGISKIRLTGGEPLLRRNVDRLVAKLVAIPQIEDLALTTNGFLFAQNAEALRSAGLKRISFSLDSLDAGNFERITGRDGLKLVLDAIKQARELGFSPIKINAVVMRGLNDHEIVALANFAQEQEVIMRFIEFMPLDSSRAWQKDHVVSKKEILERLLERFDLEDIPPAHASETARRWRFRNGSGEIGIIAPVSEPFCGNCDRLRLTSDGKIRTCLFSLHEHDLKPILRGEVSEPDLQATLRGIVSKKEERHHIGETDFVQPDRTMSFIGG